MTDSKDAEIQNLQLALAELDKRIQTIVKSFPLGLVIVNSDQCIEALNQRARDIFQFSSSEISQSPAKTLFPSVTNFEPTLEPMRLEGIRKSGEKFMAEVLVTELEMYGEQRLFVNVQDIDERYRLERLRQDLIEIVSHDLRGPLTAVQFTLEMLDDGTYGDQTPDGKEAIGMAMTSILYLMSMVRNLLDSEKIENGQIEIKREEASVQTIVEKAVGTARAANSDRSVSIEAEYTNDQCFVDADRIVQVLLNLISNAIKFSPKDSRVVVRAGIDGVDVKFEVSDQGAGIPEEQRELVFERYRQLEQDGERKKGFGLGLAICKELIEQHDGRIWIETSKEGGSTFCFSVPIGD